MLVVFTGEGLNSLMIEAKKNYVKQSGTKWISKVHFFSQFEQKWRRFEAAHVTKLIEIHK